MIKLKNRPFHRSTLLVPLAYKLSRNQLETDSLADSMCSQPCHSTKGQFQQLTRIPASVDSVQQYSVSEGTAVARRKELFDANTNHAFSTSQRPGQGEVGCRSSCKARKECLLMRLLSECQWRCFLEESRDLSANPIHGYRQRYAQFPSWRPS